jgi:hypothetical protein
MAENPKMDIDTSKPAMIYHCARCGQDHELTEFFPFNGNPIEDSDGIWDWWAFCPVTGDPILMRVLPDSEVQESPDN